MDEFDVLYDEILSFSNKKEDNSEKNDELFKFNKKATVLSKKVSLIMDTIYPDQIELYKNGHSGVVKLENVRAVLNLFVSYYDLIKDRDGDVDLDFVITELKKVAENIRDI